MKPLLSLVLTASLVSLLPLSGLAQDDDQKNKDKDKKDDKGHPQHSDKGVKPQVVHGAQGTPSGTPHVDKVHTVNGVTPQSVTQQAVQGSSHHVQNQVQFTPPQGTRGNHYGGRWVGADAHSDWGNSGEHYWHHHHYQWYDGGWLIIDTGYAPVYQGGSIASAVQQRLAEQGYYRGPIDGDIGPGSSRAIANYQGDHGLRVTGHISDGLVESLGLQ